MFLDVCRCFSMFVDVLFYVFEVFRSFLILSRYETMFLLDELMVVDGFDNIMVFDELMVLKVSMI